MDIPSKLLPLFRDPVGLAALEREGSLLINRAENRSYPIVEGIPVLLDASDVGPQNTKIQKMYGWMARGFDVVDRIGNLVSLGLVTRERRKFAQRLSLKAGDRCLYTSIGTGLDLPFLAECVAPHSIELVGLDLSMEMLRECRKKFGPYSASMLVQANAERLPFADASFDVVFHIGGINLFDRPADAVKEMARVAKPGALVVIGDETKDVAKNQYQKYNPFTRKAMKGIRTDFEPRSWVPEGATDLTYEVRQPVPFLGFYYLTFRSPASLPHKPA